MSEIAEMIVSAGWEGGDAERGLERLGTKFDQTVGRFRNAQGQFVSYVSVQRQMAQATLDNASTVGQLTGQLQQGVTAARNFGMTLTASVTLPLAAAMTYIIATGSKTSQTLNQFQGVSRATAEEMERVRAKAKELGADILLPGTSAGQAAQAMLELNKGGLSIEESMNAARGSIQLARAAIVSEGQAATVTASALNTYKLAGDQAARVGDVLANAANKSTGEIMDFASGLAQAGMVANSSNVSLEETMAVLSMLANAGVKGSDAGTAFKTFLLALRGPSDDARKAMQSLGVEVYDSAGRLKPLGDIISQFTSKLRDVKDESRDAFLDKVFGSDAARVAIALFGEGREEFEKYVAAMSEAGTAQRVAEANTRGLRGAWDALLSTVETLADSVFEDMEEPLAALVRMMTGAVSRIQDLWDSLGPGVKSALAGFLVFAAALGPVIVAVSGVASAFLGVMGAVGGLKIAAAIATLAGTTITAALAPVAVAALKLMAVVGGLALAVGAAVAAISAAWTTNFLGIREVTLRVWDAIKTHVTASLEIVRAAWERTYPTLLSLTTKVLAAIEAAWESWGKHVVNAVLTVWEAVAPIMRRVGAIILDVIDLVLKVIDGDWDGAWKAFARIVLNAIETATTAFARLKLAFISAVIALVSQILSLGERFREAASRLALQFLLGLDQAIRGGVNWITNAIIDLLIQAASGVNVDVIAAGIAARFIASLKEAIASGTASVAAAAGPALKTEHVDFGNAEQVDLNTGRRKGAGGGRDLNLGGGGGGRKGGGGGAGESAIMKSLKLQLDALNEAAQVAQRIYQRRSDNEQFYYENGYRSAYAYYSMLETLERERFRAIEEAGIKEVAIAEKTLSEVMARAAKIKDPLKRSNAVQEAANAAQAANNKLDQIYAEHEQNLTKIQRDGWRTRIEEGRAAWASETARLEQYAGTQAEIYRRLADHGIKTFAEAQRVIAAAQLELLIREQKRIQNELKGLDPESTRAKDLRGQLALQNQRIADFRAVNPHDEAAEARRDVERESRRAADLRSIWESIADSDRSIQADRLRILEASGVRRETIWKKQMELDLAMEREASRRRVDELKRQIELVSKLEGNPEHRLALIRAYNEQIKAEERRTVQERLNIVEDFYKKHDDRLREHMERAVGVLRKAVDAYREDGWGGFFKSLAEDFRNVLLQMAEDLLKSRLLQLLRNVYKIPAPGSTQGTGGAAGQSQSNEFLDLFRRILNPGQASGADEVSEAGEAMKGAIEAGGDQAARQTARAGENQAISIRTVGVSIVSALAAIGSQMAAGAGRGSFWKGLLFAAASGAISGAMGAIFKPSDGGSSSSSGDGLSDYRGPSSNPGYAAMGGVFPAKPGGRLITVAEGGYDELILTTDPKYRERMRSLLSAYVARTGIGAEGFARGGFASGYVPPAPASVSEARGASGVTVKELRVVVNSNGEMTPQQAQRTGRQVARATHGALSQFNPA